MGYETYKINESDFTATTTLANQFTELFMRTVDRGVVDGLIPGREFYGLIYGLETPATYTGGAADKTFTFGDTLGVADNPNLGTSTKATDEIYVYYTAGATNLGTAMTQDNDGGSSLSANHFSLSTDRKSVVLGYDGTNGIIHIFYLLSGGTLRLDVKNADKSIRRQLMTWKLKHINTHNIVDIHQKIIMPNAWLVDERYLYGFSVNSPVAMASAATSGTYWAGDGGVFNPTKLSVWIMRANKNTLSQADKQMVQSYTSQMR